MLVAKRTSPSATPVTPDMVETKQVDPSAVVGYRAHGSVAGRRSAGSRRRARRIAGLAGYVRHRQGHRRHLGAAKPGEKAVTLQLDRATGVDFLVKPGDMVDVVVSQDVQVLQETADSTSTAASASSRSPGWAERENRQDGAPEQARPVRQPRTSRRSRQAPRQAPGQKAPDAAAAVHRDAFIVVVAGTDQDAELVKFAQRDMSERDRSPLTIRSTAGHARMRRRPA